MTFSSKYNYIFYNRLNSCKDDVIIFICIIIPGLLRACFILTLVTGISISIFGEGGSGNGIYLLDWREDTPIFGLIFLTGAGGVLPI